MFSGQALDRSYRASNGAQEVVMRHVYMLRPGAECVGSKIAANVYASSLVRARAAG